ITYENHAERNEVPSCYVEDLQSRNGTELNGAPLNKKVPLCERDRIKIGRTVLGFFFRDDEELIQEETLYNSATKDMLTGIDNRHQMISHVKHYLALSNRREMAFCLLLIDVDHFKKVNDTYGHHIGDQALIHLAAIL